MAQSRVYEGTWAELADHADEFKEIPGLRLIVPRSESGSTGRYRDDLTPDQRIELLDALAERNRDIPALPNSAFDREALYADDDTS
jgi:hypothetical protein